MADAQRTEGLELKVQPIPAWVWKCLLENILQPIPEHKSFVCQGQTLGEIRLKVGNSITRPFWRPTERRVWQLLQQCSSVVQPHTLQPLTYDVVTLFQKNSGGDLMENTVGLISKGVSERIVWVLLVLHWIGRDKSVVCQKLCSYSPNQLSSESL